MSNKTNYKIGHQAETIAIWYLRLKGYHLIQKNFTVKKGTNAGEIDIIMRKKNTLVFVEVKKRQTYLLAAESITVKNQMRTVNASAVFLQKNKKYQNYDIRYDAILFKRGSLWPKHLVSAWRVL